MVIPLRLHPHNFNGVLHLQIIPSAIPGVDWTFQPTPINHFAIGDQFSSRTVQRSTIIEDLLLTKSKCKIKVNILGNLGITKDIDLACA